MRRRWRALRDGLVIAAVTLGGLVGVEVMLGILFPGDRLGRHPFPSRLVPERTETYVRSPANGGAAIEWRSNRWGFRGPDVELETNLPRIMVYGDSNVLARFSPLEATFVYQLGEQLERLTGRPHQVINAGKTGFGPDEVALRIAEDIDQWRPDLVIVNLFADNDLGDLFRNNLFRLDAGGAVHLVGERTDGAERFAMFLETLSTYRIAALASNALFGQSEAMGRTGRLPGEDELAYLRRRVDEEYRNHLAGVRTGGPDHYDLDVALDPDAPSSRLKLQLLAGVIARIRDQVAAGGAELLFVTEPSSKDVSTNSPLNHTVLQALSPRYARSNLTDAITGVLDAQGVAYVNLFDALLSAERSPHYFVVDDNHWNDSGQALAAEIVADQLRAQGAITATAAVRGVK